MQPLQWSSTSAQTPSIALSLCINAKWKGPCTPQSHRALHHWPLLADAHVATFIFPQPCSDHIFPFPGMHADSPLPTEKCPHASVGSSETSPACPAFINFFLMIHHLIPKYTSISHCYPFPSRFPWPGIPTASHHYFHPHKILPAPRPAQVFFHKHCPHTPGWKRSPLPWSELAQCSVLSIGFYSHLVFSIIICLYLFPPLLVSKLLRDEV